MTLLLCIEHAYVAFLVPSATRQEGSAAADMLDSICSDDFFEKASGSFNLNILQHILLHCQSSPSRSMDNVWYRRSESSSTLLDTLR